MPSVYCVSDLHLFCRRSTAAEHMPAIESAVAEAEAFVLTGDIFDFRWTSLPTYEETVWEAISWLSDLTSSNASCHFHYVFGNHDALEVFAGPLNELAADRPNLTCHADRLRLGSAVFLHGDVAHRRMTAEDLLSYRGRWMYDRKKGAFSSAVYDAAFALGLVGPVYRAAFPRRLVAKRLAHYLENVGDGFDAGTRAVYYGHTHVPVDGYEYCGLRFHNGGACLPGVDFRVLKANTGAQEAVHGD